MYGSGESSNFGTSQPHSAFSYPEQFRGLPQASNFALQQITQNLSGSTTEQRLPGNKRRQLVDDNDKENQQPSAKKNKSCNVKAEKAENPSATIHEDEEYSSERGKESSEVGDRSESESTESESSEASEHSNHANLGNPLAQSTPYSQSSSSAFQLQGIRSQDYWGTQYQNSSAAAQLQMASYLGYRQQPIGVNNGQNSLNTAFTDMNSHCGNALSQQQIMAYANYPPWNSMTPVTPICPPQSQNSFTTPNLSRFQSNNQSNVSLNFSNLGNNFDGSMNTPDSGYANANNASILSLQRQQKQANQSENIARGGGTIDSGTTTGSSSGAGTDESYTNQSTLNNKYALSLTPQYGNHIYRPHQLVDGKISFDPNMEFCQVAGRLTLLSNGKTYKITLGEILRRTSSPESLNASFLGGILRKAKKENGGKELRELLKRYGIILPPGRRKMHPSTTFTALCEEEAKQMAIDYDVLCKDFFPANQLARLLMKPIKDNPREAGRKLNAVQDARQLVDQLITSVDIMEQESIPFQPPFTTDGTEASQMLNDAREGVFKFSRLTHGFAPLAMITAWKGFSAFLKSCSVELGGDSTPQSSANELANLPGTSKTINTDYASQFQTSYNLYHQQHLAAQMFAQNVASEFQYPSGSTQLRPPKTE
ncbi:transcription factor AP-2 domain-containing protein [Ditylenchus destructor]|uniref:Transcription factor AP-2 domain-containing protein n=1 Tax=Ditylenchus destructor TaxID=166010 RepID=A0AAD4NHQ3_9BILA|nr:transcription factor AP-2 domain-containing protein [Ditylenchus destructor]